MRRPFGHSSQPLRKRALAVKATDDPSGPCAALSRSFVSEEEEAGCPAFPTGSASEIRARLE